MVDTTISSANLNILGGPTTVQVSVDYGQRGERGSLILYGQGKPYVVSLQESPTIYDMYVNLLPSDDEYQWVYQYINTPSGPAWTALFKLQPNTYSDNQTATFVNGEAELWLPVSAVAGQDQSMSSLTASNFNVQYSIVSQSPISSSISIGDVILSPTEVLSLPVTISAVEFVDNSWTAISDQKIVHLFVTVV
jgi:hypothetical protein